MRKPLNYAVALLTLAVTTPLAQGAELNPDHVSPEAKWLLHVNVEEARESATVDKLQKDEKQNRAVAAINAWLQKRYGVKREDVKAITLYDTRYEDDAGVALLYADYDQQKVEDVLKREPNYRKTEHAGYTLHTWTAAEGEFGEPAARERKPNRNQKDRDAAASETKDDAAASEKKAQKQSETKQDRGERQPEANRNEQDRNARDERNRDRRERRGQQDSAQMTAALVEGQLVIFSSSQERVKNAVDVVASEQKGLADDSKLLQTNVPAGTIVYGSAINLQDAEEDSAAGLFRDVSRATLVFGEKGLDEMFAQIAFNTASPKAAAQVHDVLVGIKAAAALADDPQARQNQTEAQRNLADKLQKITEFQVRQDQEIVTIEMTMDSEQLADLMDQVWNDVQRNWQRPAEREETTATESR